MIRKAVPGFSLALVPAILSCAAPITPADTNHIVTMGDYPAESIGLGEQGVVQLKYRVGEDGAVTDCAITMSSGQPRLDDAACTMVRTRWKFKPATRNGMPVAADRTATVEFRLR